MSMPTSVRLPDALRDQVAGLARDERRSFAGQVQTLLEAGLAAVGLTPATRLPDGEQAILDELRRLGAREVER